MELSELVDFGGMLLTMDDRTGLSVVSPLIVSCYLNWTFTYVGGYDVP